MGRLQSSGSFRRGSRRPRWLVAAATLVGALAGTGRQAHATDWSVPHSWKWPLYVRHEVNSVVQTGQPRPAIWNSAGELQNYPGTPPYLHPGDDMRGNVGDPVVVPADGNIAEVFNYNDACQSVNSECRVYLQTSDARYAYYFGHVDLGSTPTPGPTPITTEMRTTIQNAVNGVGDTTVSVGQKIAQLAEYEYGTVEWDHLHFGLYDSQQTYALQDVRMFLEQNPTGDDGETLTIVDDEPPVIVETRLTADQDPNLASVITAGACGDEVKGNLDIAANIYDTFFTNGSFATFPGLGTLPPTTEVRTARYLVQSLASPGTPVASGTWYDLISTPMTCAPATSPGVGECITAGLSNISLSQFLGFMTAADTNDFTDNGAPNAGLPILNQLFDLSLSSSQFATPNGEVYWHILTNAEGMPGSWDTTKLADGRYQVSVEATDFAGNSTASSRFVTVHNAATPLDTTGAGFGDVFIRDNPTDTGAVPSTLGGQPFWESPDIILVPSNTPVEASTPATETLVTAGVSYDIWVRLNNTGCQDVNGAMVKLFTAAPSMVANSWVPVPSASSYTGLPSNPTVGIPVPHTGPVVIGPFPWTPTEAEAQAGGHRCMLADVIATNDPLAAANEADAPDFNNVGQRNLQLSDCSFALTSPSGGQLSIALKTDADVTVPGTTIEFVIANFDPSWATAWAKVAGTSVSTQGSNLVVAMLVQAVTLPAVTVSATTSATASFVISLPAGSPTHTVSATPSLNGVTVTSGGGTCAQVGPPPPPPQPK